jgi:hypothetical protein|tara:strand:- start:108 stop:662 length:555 start_codon:yes stop_codon:yes gene_type:complete
MNTMISNTEQATRKLLLWVFNTYTAYNAMREFVASQDKIDVGRIDSNSVEKFFFEMFPNGTPDMDADDMVHVDWDVVAEHLLEEAEAMDKHHADRCYDDMKRLLEKAGFEPEHMTSRNDLCESLGVFMGASEKDLCMIYMPNAIKVRQEEEFDTFCVVPNYFHTNRENIFDTAEEVLEFIQSLS